MAKQMVRGYVEYKGLTADMFAMAASELKVGDIPLGKYFIELCMGSRFAEDSSIGTVVCSKNTTVSRTSASG